MVNIVHFRLGVDQLNQISDNGDDILVGQHARVLGDVKVQFLVDTVAAYFTEVVALLGEEEFLQSGACGLLVGSCRALELQVDVLDGLLAGFGRVFLQRVEDDGVVHHLVIFLVEQHRLDIRIGDHIDVLFLEDGLAIDDHFGTFDVGDLTGLVIDEVLIPFLRHVSGELLADELLEVSLGGLHLLGDVENGEDILVRLISDGAQQGSNRQFLLSVDVRVHHVVDVGGKLHPGALEGDDAGGVERGPVSVVREAEEDARGAVQLGHHDALSTVDNKGAAGGHIGDFAKIGVLRDGFEILVLRIVAGQSQFCRQGNVIGQTSFETLVHRIAGRADGVVEKLKGKNVSGIRDGEIFFEGLV